MKFCCSKIRINGKEVIKSGLFIWEEAGLEKVSYKSSEKEDQKKWKRVKKIKSCYWCSLGLPMGPYCYPAGKAG